jgi:hypothetical protein
VFGSVTEPEIVLDALSALGLPTTAPQAARARDPTELFGDAPTD